MTSKDIVLRLRALTGGARLLGYAAAEEIERLRRENAEGRAREQWLCDKIDERDAEIERKSTAPEPVPASSKEQTLSVSTQELRGAAKSGTSDKTWLSHLLELSADEIERLQRFERMHEEATKVLGDAEVLQYVTSGNAIPVSRCTVSADLIRQLVAGRRAAHELCAELTVELAKCVRWLIDDMPASVSRGEAALASYYERTGQPPKPIQGSDLVTDHDRGYAEGYSDARASQPPSLLREVAAIAYDTSKAAEDRIRDIQDLWEGATAPPSGDHPYFIRGAREGWMRAAVFYVDLCAEANSDICAERDRRWPTPTKSCEACRATTVDDCYFSEDPPANCAFRATAGER
jgi:hypothetical protein